MKDFQSPKVSFQNYWPPWWLSRYRICLQCRRSRFDPWVGKIPWRRKWQPTPAFLPGEFQGQRSLAGYSPRGHKESDTTDWLTFLNRSGSLGRRRKPKRTGPLRRVSGPARLTPPRRTAVFSLQRAASLEGDPSLWGLSKRRCSRR